MKYIRYYDSPLGRILLASDGKFLTGLWFENSRYYADGLEKDCTEKRLPVLYQTEIWLDSYFSGKEPKILPPLLLNGSDFQKSVWNLLLTIPYGQTVTYKELAEQIAAQRGIRRMAAQAVGGAVGHNPVSVIVPCHRVVGSDGSLTGYGGGLERKKWLLSLENNRGLKQNSSVGEKTGLLLSDRSE